MLKVVENLKKFILHIFSLDTREVTAGQCTMSGQILACGSGVLLGRVNVKKLAIVYSTQFLDRENNDKNITLSLGKQICFTIVWDLRKFYLCLKNFFDCQSI